MWNRFSCFVLLCFFSFFANSAFSQPEVSPRLKEVLAETGANEKISINIRLADQYDTDELYTKSRSKKGAEEKRSFVIDELKAFRDIHQADLLAYLENKESLGKVDNIRSFWLANLVNCYAVPAIVDELMKREDIERLDYNIKRRVINEKPSEMYGLQQAEADKLKRGQLAWNIELINASGVWDMGYTGEGVIVAILDTGINYNHQDVQGSMWVHPDYPYHGYNFIDDSYNTMDYNGHGTHVAGTVAGDGSAGMATGVAPGATLMSVQVMDQDGAGTEANVWDGIEFAIDYGANIINLSLGWQQAWFPDRATWRQLMDNALSAGMVVVAASGNEGGFLTPPDEVRTPGDVPPPWLHPDQTLEGGLSAVISVGSTDETDMIAHSSSKGPVTWHMVSPYNDYPFNGDMGLIRPDVVAPGVEIPSLHHIFESGYAVKSGTSMATPAVAGLVALMWSKNPDLLPGEISEIIETTAVPLAPVKNNVYGSGRINAFATLYATPIPGIQYVSHEIDDSAGNNDGFINPGEFIELNMVFTNSVDEEINNVHVGIDTESEHITLTDYSANLGDFAGNETRSFDGLFSFNVADNIPGNYIIDFLITAYSADDPDLLYTAEFSEQAYAPYLEFSDMLVNGEPAGEVGSLAPAETAEVQITLKNTGQLATGGIDVSVFPLNEWIILPGYQTQTVPPLEAGETADIQITIAALHDTPLNTRSDLVFSAYSTPYTFTAEKEFIIGAPPPYSEGSIPSTYNPNVHTGSNAGQPGSMTITIPEEATITGVDVEYAMVSHNECWIREQRSFLRCVSPGGETEPEVYSGTGNEEGVKEYSRSGINIADSVEGNEIDFELHAFRTWGGAGTDTQYVYVPNHTWRVVVHYELPTHEVLFVVSDESGQLLENAVVKVGAEEKETNENGEVLFLLPETDIYYSAWAENYLPLNYQHFTVTGEDTAINIILERAYSAAFSIIDVHGNEVQDAKITVNGTIHPPGQYVIEGLAAGVHEYIIEAENHKTTSGEIEIVDEDVSVEVVMQPYYTISFSIEDEWGNDVVDAMIEFDEELYETGVYIIENIIPGIYDYTVSAGFFYDYADTAVVDDQDKSILVVLTADGTQVDPAPAENLVIFPNPSTGVITLEWQTYDQKPASIRIMSNEGQIVASKEAQGGPGTVRTKMNLANLSPGVYIVFIENQNWVINQKLLLH